MKTPTRIITIITAGAIAAAAGAVACGELNEDGTPRAPRLAEECTRARAHRLGCPRDNPLGWAGQELLVRS